MAINFFHQCFRRLGNIDREFLPYKVQNEKKPTFWKYISALKLILYNQIIVGLVVLTGFYKLGEIRGLGYEKELPSAFVMIRDIIVCIIVEEIGFYYTHRLFHHPHFYKYVHKTHHEWTAPVSITSIYCHPLEHAVSNLFPVLLGPLICGSHVMTVWIWAGMAVLSTTFSHSGYHFPFQPSPEAHDYHHKVFNECFGVLGWLDTFHDTNKTFRKSVHYSRHYTSATIVPIKLIHPDEKEKKEQ
ncbi:unnamed protein product [Caenorhabditis auriculariae]|uniref:Fatty acid hydroxylase domain-containing protein n=1 Tax=Caenorhabditis auriculariae TaxID=2777116 RepID=A0A8S1H5W7_9PELO|nr:unnamed protein product [Caenorhabditis auriculariae]